MKAFNRLFAAALAGTILAAGSIAFVGCKKDDDSVPVPESQRSPHFEAVADRLDIGGMMFAYMDIDNDATRLAADANRLMAMVAESQAGEVPPEMLEQLDFEALVADLGLDRLVAIGASSVRNGDRFLNKAILYTPEGRSGVFKLLGGMAEPFTSLKMAPEDADLVLERDLNLKAAMDIGQRIAARFPQGSANFTQAMQQNMLNLGMSVGDFLGKFDTKLIVIGRVDPDTPMEMAMVPMELPELDLLIALHNVPWLWAQIKNLMPPEGEGPFEYSKGDGFEAYNVPDMAGNPRLNPQLYFDKASKLILISTSAEYIATCLEPGTTIESSADFKAATAGLPTEGNGLSYFSPDISRTIMNLFESSMAMSQTSSAEAEMGLEMIKMFVPELPEGVASVSVNMEDGIYVTSNAYESHKSTMMMTANPTVIGILAAMGMPAFQRVQMQANSVQQTSNLRQVALACKVYAVDNEGAFPDSLIDLTPDYIDELAAEELMFDNRIGFAQPLHYNRGLSEDAPGDLVLVATPEDDSGKRVVAYVDGSVEEIEAFLFEAQQEATEDYIRENANR